MLGWADVLLPMDRYAALIVTESSEALPVGRRWEQAHNPTPGCGLSANPSHIQPPSLHHPLWSLCKAGPAPTVYFCLRFFYLPILQSDSLEILVTILNENDNSPVFAQPNLTRDVPEVRGFWKGRGHCLTECCGTEEGSAGRGLQSISHRQ